LEWLGEADARQGQRIHGKMRLATNEQVLENHCVLLYNYPPDARTTREMTDSQTITSGIDQ
jgi:hypothetical protein